MSFGAAARHHDELATAMDLETLKARRTYEGDKWWANGWGQTKAAVADYELPIANFSGATGITWSQVAAGAIDSFLKDIARGLASLNREVYVSWQVEPDLSNHRQGTEGDYVRAFRRVYKVMKPLAPKVKIGPCFMAWSFRKGGPANLMYPGNDHCDLIMVDGYNWAGCQYTATGDADSDSLWKSPSQVFDFAKNYAASKTKPLYVAEVGCAFDANIPLRRPAWLEGFGTYVATNGILGASYFEQDRSDGFQNWAIRDDPASRDAWKRLVTS